MTISINQLFFIVRVITIIAIPFLFLISPFLVIPAIMGLCLVYKNMINHQNTSAFLFIFLFLSLFSGIDILGIKLYDWAIVIAFFNLFFTHRNLSLRIDIPIFLSIVLVIFFINYHDYSFAALGRYALDCCLAFIIMNKDKIIPEDKKIFNDIFFSAIYFTVIIYIFISHGMISNVETGIINTKLYLFEKEIRMGGFFSDPNKYMSYMFILVFLVEAFWGEEKKKLVYILSLGAILSLSRTAFFVLVLYYFAKSMNQYYRKKKALVAFLMIIIVSICSMGFLLFSSEITYLGNEMFAFTADILGRENTLRQGGTSIDEDSRTLIWQEALPLIEESMLWGHGWLSWEGLMAHPTHNTILSLLLDGGLLALIAYIILFRELFFSKDWLIVLPLIIIPILVLDLSDYRLEFVLLGIIWQMKRIKNVDKINNKIKYSEN